MERGNVFDSYLPVAVAEDNSHTVRSAAADRNSLAAEGLLVAVARSSLDLTFLRLSYSCSSGMCV